MRTQSSWRPPWALFAGDCRLAAVRAEPLIAMRTSSEAVGCFCGGGFDSVFCKCAYMPDGRPPTQNKLHHGDAASFGLSDFALTP